MLQHDLTRELPVAGPFDLVWSYGVLHHTGDTYGAFRNVARLVKPGGRIFMMLYGEPDGSDLGTYSYYAEVEALRRQTVGNELRRAFRLPEGEEGRGGRRLVRRRLARHQRHLLFYEIHSWLGYHGFVDIRRTIEHPNHHVTATRAA